MHTHGSEPHHPRKKVVTNPDGATLYERVGGHDGLNQLVRWFYAKARYEPPLDAVFNAHIEVWSEHLATITAFWARMTGGPSTWSGGMGRHFFLNLGPEHFATWLRIRDENCRELLPPREAEDMIHLAHSIGDDLERMLTRCAGSHSDGGRADAQ